MACAVCGERPVICPACYNLAVEFRIEMINDLIQDAIQEGLNENAD